ncbi:MAG: hypothetical protein J0I18_07780, partial [Actinobacteria bacterium]|nr:hypothetical protein [Actinomycetota bacterium]
MPSELRIGILGAGGIAERAMVEPSHDVAGASVVAIGARDPERARAFAEHARCDDVEQALRERVEPVVEADESTPARRLGGFADQCGGRAVDRQWL